MVKAKSAGSFIGGIFNNPTFLILGALTIALLFFQKDIRNAFGSLGESIGGGLGDINIQLPEFKFPEFTFPEIKFPEFKFPDFEFPDINIDLPDFNAIFAGFQEQIDKGFAGITPQVEPERMDVPFDVPGREDLPPIDIVPDFGLRDDPRRTKPEPEPTVIFRDAERFAEDFPEVFRPIEIPFAVANVEESQGGFIQRAAAFVRAQPEITAFTSLPGSFQGFGRQLSRESEDFESVLAAEARRSESIFAGLFGNVQNPNF